MKKLGKWEKKLLKLKAESVSDLTKKIKSLGFKQHKAYWAWINKDEGIVVKVPYITSCCRKPPEKYRIPTHSFQMPCVGTIFVQPLCFTGKKAVHKARVELRNAIPFLGECDSHDGNIGTYRGKAYFFDW